MSRSDDPPFRHADRGEARRLAELEQAANLQALGHIFPPESYPFPFVEVRARWTRLLVDSAVRIGVTDDEHGPAALVAFDDERLRHLAVRPDRWRTGLATAALAWAEDLGSFTHLWCLEDNAQALAFYEQRGWRPTGRTQPAEFPPFPTEVELQRAR